MGDGYQHEINNDAKQGKASPTAETKLAYTMDNIKTEQAREALRRQGIMKKEREILVKMDDLKKLDGEMTKMAGGGHTSGLTEDRFGACSGQQCGAAACSASKHTSICVEYRYEVSSSTKYLRVLSIFEY